MNQTISFFAQGEPRGQPRPRAFVRRVGNQAFARVYDDGTAENWKSCIAAAAKPHAPSEPLTGPLQVDCIFYFPRLKGHFGSGKNEGRLKESAPRFHVVRPDLDNAIKAVLDALTHLRFWLDDCRVVKSWSEKRYEHLPHLPAGCQITITTLEKTVDRSEARSVFALPKNGDPKPAESLELFQGALK